MEKKLGRGTLQLMTAQVVFLASGYAIHFGLGRLLGPELYGVFGIVISILTLNAVILRAGIPRAVSKFTAGNEELAGVINKKGRDIMFVLGATSFIFYFFFAGLIADLLNDRTLTPYLRLSAFAIPFFASYTVYVASLNGMRAFEKQSKTVISYSLAKVSVVLGLVLLGYSVSGAIVGYVVASLVGMLISRYYFKFKGVRGNFDTRKLIGFAIPVLLFSLANNLLMSIDLLSVKAILTENVLTGYYTAASTLAKPSFFIFVALSSTLFPSIARAYAKNDEKLVISYINKSLRYLLLLLMPTVLMVSATSENLTSLVYTDKYAPAGAALSILIFGIGFMTLSSVLNVIIMAIDRPWIAMAIAWTLVPIDVALNLILIPIYQLNGAAIATSMTAFIGMSIAAVYIFSRFKMFISLLSLVRIVIASLFIYLLSARYPPAGIFIPLGYTFFFLVYFAILWILKELKRSDIEMAKHILAP